MAPGQQSPSAQGWGMAVAASQGPGQAASCPADSGVIRTFQIEGRGASSPLVGQVVTTEGVVVGDYQEPNQLQGFFLQDLTGDGDPETSDGLFVYTPSGFPVNAGDYVRVTGKVREYASPGDTWGTLTELEEVRSVLVCATGVAVGPTPVTLPLASTGDLERYEGMLVSFPQTLTVSEVYNLGRFGEISLSAGGRLFHPNNGNALGDTAMGNPLRRILLDDGSNVQNPRPIPYLSAADTSGTRRVGDSVVGLTGVLSYGFSSYRVEPVGTVNFIPSNPRPEAPEDVGGSLRVASYNVLNYFTTLGARGASNQAELERQRAKLVAALRALDADIVGLIEIQNNGDAALEDLVRALNTALGSDAYTALATGSLGTDQIKVALIYKPARVRPEGAFRIDDDPIYSRPPLAQTFRDRATGGRFSVVVNHFKSKGCEGASGAETDTGQGCWNALRVRQAQRLLTFINDLRATDPDVLVVGDLNAYAEEDPLKVLTGAGLENLILHISAAKRYSYVFNGESGNLDHALATSSLSSQVTGITEWHINADEPRVLDYNTEFKPDDRYAPTPFRSSDHDPLLVGLNLRADPEP